MESGVSLAAAWRAVEGAEVEGDVDVSVPASLPAPATIELLAERNGDVRKPRPCRTALLLLSRRSPVEVTVS